MQHVLKTKDGLFEIQKHYLDQINRQKMQTNNSMITLIHEDNKHFIEVECVNKDDKYIYWEIYKKDIIEKAVTREPRGFSFAEDMDQLSLKIKEHFTFTKSDIRKIFKVSAETTRYIIMNDQSRISDNSFMKAADNFERWELRNKKKYATMK